MRPTRARTTVTATILCLLAAYGCETPRSPDARVAPPPSTSAPVESVPPTSPSPSPVVAPPPPDPLAGVPPACRGAALSFDTEQSAMGCLYEKDRDLPPPPPASALEITASIVEPSIARGGTATVLLTMTNKTTEPMLLYPDLTCDDEPGYKINVLDAKGKRVDLVAHKNCDSNTFGCSLRVARVVLEPGGSLRQKHSFVAKVTKVTADCGEVVAGSMRPGTYRVRVLTPFRPASDSPYKVATETTLLVK